MAIFVVLVFVLIVVWITNFIKARKRAMAPMLEEEQQREAVKQNEEHEMDEVGKMEQYYSNKAKRKKGQYQPVFQGDWPLEDGQS